MVFHIFGSFSPTNMFKVLMKVIGNVKPKTSTQQIVLTLWLLLGFSLSAFAADKVEETAGIAVVGVEEAMFFTTSFLVGFCP